MKSLQKGLRKIETHLDFREKYIFSVNLFQGTRQQRSKRSLCGLVQPLSRIEGFLYIQLYPLWLFSLIFYQSELGETGTDGAGLTPERLGNVNKLQML